MIWLMGSGGVSAMPRKNAITMANLRNLRNVAEDINPSQPSTNSMSGIWKTRPKAIMSFSMIDM